MPKKKPRRHAPQRSGARGASRRWERDVDALLAQFVLARRQSVPVEQADEEAAHVETLLRLKAERLESPDPTWWTEELLEVLLLDVAPRVVIQPREMAMVQGAALGQFFRFLRGAGRWHRDGMTVERALELVADLEIPALEAADDPSRRSFSGNIISYASSLGVSIEDPDQLEAFMQWYNEELTTAERQQISDTGRLPNPRRPFAPGATTRGPGNARGSAFFGDPGGPVSALGGADDLLRDQPEWPWFLPRELPVTDPVAEAGFIDPEQDPAGAAAAYARIPLVPRAVALLDLVQEARAVTSTGALRLADVRTLVEDWGVDLGELRLTTMWQVDEIVGPWTALNVGGWLTLTSTRVRRSDGAPAAPAIAAEDPQGFVDFAGALMSILLLAQLREGPEDGGLEGGRDTLAALITSSVTSGLVLPDGLLAARDEQLAPLTADGALDWPEALRFITVTHDLAKLSGYGLLEREDLPATRQVRYRGGAELLTALLSALAMRDELDGE